jgi:hypothetical protein
MAVKVQTQKARPFDLDTYPQGDSMAVDAQGVLIVHGPPSEPGGTREVIAVFASGNWVRAERE